MWKTVVLALGLTLSSAACASTSRLAVLGGGPGTPGDPRILDDAIRGAQSLGYQPRAIDGVEGRFRVEARSDRTGLTSFEVQCFREGQISVMPRGGAVAYIDGELQLPANLRREYERLAVAIANAIEVRP